MKEGSGEEKDEKKDLNRNKVFLNLKFKVRYKEILNSRFQRNSRF